MREIAYNIFHLPNKCSGNIIFIQHSSGVLVMKVLMKPIEVISWHGKEKDTFPRPIRFRLSTDEGNVVVDVKRVLHKGEEKVEGHRFLTYRCESIINGIKRELELRFEKESCRWWLFRI